MWGLILIVLRYIEVNPIQNLAAIIGTAEPALNILLSIVMAYPLAYIYHKYVRKHVEYRNIYFILCGMDMALYNFGTYFYHNVIPVIVIYFTTMVLGPGKYNVIVTFVFNMGYLLLGYVTTESENYDITWTMPHCVLTLKLIALSFDLWDGQKKLKGEILSSNNKKTALEKPPTILELFGFVYFPACFLVGPIFSFSRYHDYINNKFPLDRDSGIYEKLALKKLCQGILYMVAYKLGVHVFNVDYMLSDDFSNNSIFYRHFYCGQWAHFALYKYISCWLLTEACCIRFGLSYNGDKVENEKLVSQWDGCNNVKLLQFERATKFQHYIDSFNCNTNHFAAEYVYKRLKFLGNRNLSQLFTLLFLAIWHGTWSGYYITFFNEFIIIYFERELEYMISRTEIYKYIWSNVYTKYLLYAVLKVYTIVFMGWSLVPFDLKVFNKWWHVYYCLYFSGFLLFLPWALVYKTGLKYLFKRFNVKEVKSE